MTPLLPVQEEHLAGERRARVAAEQVAQACAQRGAESLLIVAVIAVSALVAWPRGPVLSWAALAALAAGVRWLLPAARAPLVAGTMLSAAALGAGYALLANGLLPAERTFLVVTLTGLAAGGLVRLSVLPEAAAAWILPLLIPPVAWHVASASRGDLELSLLLTAFVGALLFAARRMGASRRRAIEQALDNEDLRAGFRAALEDSRRDTYGLKSLIEHATDLIAVITPEGQPIYTSPALQRLMEAVDAQRPIEMVHPEDRGRVLAAQAELAAGQVTGVPQMAWRVAQPDGDWREVEGSARLLTEGPYQGAVVLAARDVTRRNEMARQLARKEELVRALFEAAPDPIFYKDEHGVYLGCNAAYAQIIGRDPDEVPGLTDRQIHPPDVATRSSRSDREAIDTGKVLRDEYWMELADGKRVLLDTVKCPFHDEQGRAVGVVGICRDITEFRELEDRLRQAATTDALTGLMNRRRLDEVLGEEWGRARRQKEPISVIMADVDHFGAYNDALGHVAGDAALAQVADRIRRCVARPGDVVARYGGEEFTLVLPHTGPAGAVAVASQVLEAVRKAGLAHPASDAGDVVTVSLGVATAVPGMDQPVSELVAAADEALYDAKEAGRNTLRTRELK